MSAMGQKSLYPKIAGNVRFGRKRMFQDKACFARYFPRHAAEKEERAEEG
jgi:hypothetical protein